MDIQDKIDAYAKNKMTPSERAAFEQDIEKDADLQERVRQARFEVHVGNRITEKNIRSWMKEWDENDDGGGNTGKPTDPSSPGGGSKGPWYFGLAAIAVALLFTAWWAFFQQETITPPKDTDPHPSVRDSLPNPKDTATLRGLQQDENKPDKQKQAPTKDLRPRYIAMADAHFKIDEDILTRRANPSQATQQTLVQQAVDSLAAKKYSTVIRMLEPMPESDPDYVAGRKSLATAYFFQRDFPAAEQALQVVLNSISDDSAEEWNLLMFYLAQYPQKVAEQKALLQKILNDPGHPDYEEAKKLAADLRTIE